MRIDKSNALQEALPLLYRDAPQVKSPGQSARQAGQDDVVDVTISKRASLSGRCATQAPPAKDPYAQGKHTVEFADGSSVTYTLLEDAEGNPAPNPPKKTIFSQLSAFAVFHAKPSAQSVAPSIRNAKELAATLRNTMLSDADTAAKAQANTTAETVLQLL